MDDGHVRLSIYFIFLPPLLYLIHISKQMCMAAIFAISQRSEDNIIPKSTLECSGIYFRS